MLDWTVAQKKLGVDPDGKAGPDTWTALLTKIATLGGHHVPVHARELAKGFVAHVSAYQVDDNAERLAQLLGQCAHESGPFVYMRELWGPTAAQKKYDLPGNRLGNTAGDGFAMRGAGLIQVTGRSWFAKIGTNVGLDLVGMPALLDQPDICVVISLEWWKLNKMNLIADTGDRVKVSKAVNLGNPNSTHTPNGLAERVKFTNIAEALLA